jgi:hypothetical protein
MKPKTKIIILISSCSLLFVALFVWYFFPVLAYKWLWHANSKEFENYLNLKPVVIKKLNDPPQEWQKMDIGGIFIKLPLSKYKKIISTDHSTIIFSGKEVLMISNIVQTKEIEEMIQRKEMKYPFVSYKERLNIINSTPADISFFNSRDKNMSGFINQELKIMSISIGGLSKTYIVDTENLKAVCEISEKREKGYLANVSIYNKNENMFFSLIFNSKDLDALESDIFAILGGIKMPEKTPEKEQVVRDIDNLIGMFNKKKH